MGAGGYADATSADGLPKCPSRLAFAKVASKRCFDQGQFTRYRPERGRDKTIPVLGRSEPLIIRGQLRN